MKKRKGFVAIFPLILFLFQCKNQDVKIAPTNLVVTPEISTDGSGLVKFTTSANNAISYAYNFGDGSTKTTSLNVITYKFKTLGTKTYTVTVRAKSQDNLEASTSLDVTVNYAGPQLVWSDEFNTDGAPNASKWDYDLGDGCPNNCGWGNNEAEYYTSRAQNVSISGGTLKITALKENYMGKPYTSTRMLTQNKFAFTYGAVEVRAKLPIGAGTWPAVWMLGANINSVSWPACGEIDIMEHVGKNLNTIYGTLHYPGRSGGNADGSTTMVPTATSDFHIYKLQWDESTIKISVDGNVFHTVTNSQSLPFNQDFFIILNVAMGGNFGGPVDASINSATMEIDYLRVYQ